MTDPQLSTTLSSSHSLPHVTLSFSKQFPGSTHCLQFLSTPFRHFRPPLAHIPLVIPLSSHLTLSRSHSLSGIDSASPFQPTDHSLSACHSRRPSSSPCHSLGSVTGWPTTRATTFLVSRDQLGVTCDRAAPSEPPIQPLFLSQFHLFSLGLFVLFGLGRILGAFEPLTVSSNSLWRAQSSLADSEKQPESFVLATSLSRELFTQSSLPDLIEYPTARQPNPTSNNIFPLLPRLGIILYDLKGLRLLVLRVLWGNKAEKIKIEAKETAKGRECLHDPLGSKTTYFPSILVGSRVFMSSIIMSRYRFIDSIKYRVLCMLAHESPIMYRPSLTGHSWPPRTRLGFRVTNCFMNPWYSRHRFLSVFVNFCLILSVLSGFKSEPIGYVMHEVQRPKPSTTGSNAPIHIEHVRPEYKMGSSLESPFHSE
ncbi:hypothetical protein CRG98_030068 [Punica granatum]|uniref:Uncharacterized protein n=1 Tax=Punica granatum TaxID=22663 RepID=A0A2I0IZV4_PUNGR|nr:hypothetical protein CRG98_030068 [Punica granatum]